MGGITFRTFNSAFFVIDRSVRTVGIGCGEKMTVPVTWSVVEHPQGIVVIDTGVNKTVIGSADAGWFRGEARLGAPLMRPGQEIETQLRGAGLGVGDVRYVVNTHLHGDHVGGNLDIPGATFLCQQEEFEYAKAPDIPFMVREYPQSDIGGDRLSYQFVAGELDLFGDGTVRIFPTPGHTPGHQSVLVRLPKTGPVLVTGDALSGHELLDERTLPAICWWPSQYVKSRRKLVEVKAQEGARWFFSHDVHSFGSLGWTEGGVYS